MQGEFVQLRQEAERDAGDPHQRRAPPAHVVAPHPHHDHHQHADAEQERGHRVHQRCRLVAGAQLLVIARPLLRHLQIFAIAARLRAQHGHRNPVRSVAQAEPALLPCEGAVGTVRAHDFGALHEIHRARIAAHAGTQKVLRDRARAAGGRVRPGGVVGQRVGEARQFAARSDLHRELFLLQRAEPAVGPAPQPHARPHDAVGLLQSGFAFQEGLGLVVVIELRGFAVTFHLVVLRGQELRCQHQGLVAVDLKIDRCFGEGAVEIARAEPDRGAEQRETDRNEAVVAGCQAGPHFSAQCSPIPPRMYLRASTLR